MKKFRFIAMMFVAIMTCVTFSACSDDDDDNSGNTSEIVGTWYATVANGKARIYLTFNSDNTGQLDYEWDNVNYTRAIYTFTYTYSGGNVKCNGTIVHSSDGTSPQEMTFKYSNGQLTGGRWTTDSPYRKR